MKKQIVFALAVSLLATTGCISVTEYNSQSELYRKALSAKEAQLAETAAKLMVKQSECEAKNLELAKLSVRLEESQKQRLALENELAALRKKFTQEYVSIEEIIETTEYNIPPLILNRYIKHIIPSANASPEEKRKYIHALGQLSDGINSNRLREAITASLISLGHDYFNDMLPYLDKSVFQQAASSLAKPSDKPALKAFLLNPARNNRYGVINIYAALADESDKEDVLKLLPQNPNLLSCVTRLGIEKQAVPFIKKLILENGNTSNQYFEIVLKNSSEAEAAEFLNTFWRIYVKNADANRWGNNMELLLYLARRGFLPAFVRLVETAQSYGNDPYRINMILALGQSGSIGELVEWVKKNKDHLVFDKEKMQYAVKTADIPMKDSRKRN